MSEKLVKVGGEDISLDVLNSKLIADIKAEGQCKVASELSNSYIRMINREDGFMRKILPPETVSEADIQKSDYVGQDRPYIVVTVEPTGSPAVSLPFNSSAPIQYYYASKAIVSFFDIKTPRFQKNVYELMTYRDIDLRKVIVDNALKDLQKEEDAQFIARVDEVCLGGTAGNLFSFAGGLDRDTWVEVSKIMGKKMLRNGIALMNDATVREFGKLSFNNWGGDGSQKVWKEGMSGMGDSSLFGINILSTLKADLVNDNVVYLFTEPDYLGKLYELKKPTMYVKREEDILTVNASEKIGCTIVNTAGVAKVNFLNTNTLANTQYPLYPVE